MPIKQKSRTRLQAREAERKLMPAIKAISSAVHKTGPIPGNFKGYKVPAGELSDHLGRKWQYQITAIISKSDFIKKDEVVPMFKGWSLGIRVKAFLKYVIDWTNK